MCESLEQRRLLAADLVNFHLQTADMAGNPIEVVASGDNFLLQVYVEDTRDMPQGVFTAYADVVYESSLVSVAGPVVFGSQFGNYRSAGETDLPGVIDEVGSGSGSLKPIGGGRHLLFTIPFRAEASGTAVFNAEPADFAISHDILLYGLDDPVQTSQIDFGWASVEIRSVASVAYSPEHHDESLSVATDEQPAADGVDTVFHSFAAQLLDLLLSESQIGDLRLDHVINSGARSDVYPLSESGKGGGIGFLPTEIAKPEPWPLSKSVAHRGGVRNDQLVDEIFREEKFDARFPDPLEDWPVNG